MTIELIDLDTGATMEAPADKVYGDKTSGLQFEGVANERDLQAELTKLRNALDVAEKALDFYATGEHEHPVGVIDDMYVYDNGTRAWNALEKIKQAKGEA